MHQQDPLFIGCTRPAMVWGISYEAFIAAFVASAIIFLAAGNPLYLASYVPMHAACYAICLRDPRAFRLLALWVVTKGASNSRKQWGNVSSTSPFINTRGLNKGKK